jgi:hypothetical protein
MAFHEGELLLRDVGDTSEGGADGDEGIGRSRHEGWDGFFSRTELCATRLQVRLACIS